jgi:hypothetical protein
VPGKATAPAPCQARAHDLTRDARCAPPQPNDKISTEQAQTTADYTRSGAHQGRGAPLAKISWACLTARVDCCFTRVGGSQ